MDPIFEMVLIVLLATPLVVVLFYVVALVLVLPLTGESIFRFTDRLLVDEILALVPMQPGQRFYDLGCGDGRMLIAARRKYGVHAVGYEVNPFAYFHARLKIWWHGSGGEVRFRNFMQADLSDADVIYLYQASGAIQQLRDKFNRVLKPGTIVISNTYTIERWLTPTVVTLGHGITVRNIYLYEVPALHATVPPSPAAPLPQAVAEPIRGEIRGHS